MRREVHPTREDPVVAVLSEGVGGPVGDHADRHPWWTPVRVTLALTALCFALGLVTKTPCFDDAWQDDPRRYAELCDSSLPHTYLGLGLIELDWPFTSDAQVRDRFPVTDQPAGSAYLSWGTAWVTSWGLGSPDLEELYAEAPSDYADEPEVREQVRTFVVVNALVLAALALVSAWLLAGVDRGDRGTRSRSPAAPVLLLTGVLGPELAAAACVAGALRAWSRRRLALTGALVGVGAAVLVHPLLLLVAVVLVALRRGRPADARARRRDGDGRLGSGQPARLCLRELAVARRGRLLPGSSGRRGVALAGGRPGRGPRPLDRSR